MGPGSRRLEGEPVDLILHFGQGAGISQHLPGADHIGFAQGRIAQQRFQLGCDWGRGAVQSVGDQLSTLALAQIIADGFAGEVGVAEDAEDVIAQLERYAQRQAGLRQCVLQVRTPAGQCAAEHQGVLGGVFGGLIGQHIAGSAHGGGLRVCRRSNLSQHIQVLAGDHLSVHALKDFPGRGGGSRCCGLGPGERLGRPGQGEVTDQDRTGDAEMVSITGESGVPVVVGEPSVGAGLTATGVGAVDDVVVNQGGTLEELQRDPELDHGQLGLPLVGSLPAQPGKQRTQLLSTGSQREEGVDQRSCRRIDGGDLLALAAEELLKAAIGCRGKLRLSGDVSWGGHTLDPMGSEQSGPPGRAAPIIAHVDMDAFYVEAELLDAPQLRGQKIIVAGEGRSVVLSASYQARADGVSSAMPLSRARRLSPEAVVIPPHMDRYRKLSAEIMSYFDTLTDRKEQLSVDEAFLDLSGARRRLGSPEQMGRLIRAGIVERVGLPASVGIADRKFIAKIASTRAKPDGLLVVPPADRLEFLHSLPAGQLWGVGAKTAQVLATMGLRTVKDIAETPRQALAHRLGAVGSHLHDLAWGIDPRPVEPARVEKSISAEETFAEDISADSELNKELLRLAHRVAARLRAAEVSSSGVSLKLRWRDFSTVTRSSTLAHPTQSAPDLHRQAVRLLESLSPRRQPVRLIGIRAERLSAGDGSLQLSFDAQDGDWLTAQQALDAVAGKFPGAAVRPASLLDSPRRNRDQ